MREFPEPNFGGNKMRRIVNAAPVVLLSLFLGCGDSTGPVSLGLNRLRWEKQNLHDYAFIGRRSCFCPYSGEDVIVIVVADTVSSVTLAATGAELPKFAGYTVDHIFELAQNSFGDKNMKVRVEYDPDLGYPKLVDVSCESALDCGVRIETRDLGGIVTIN